MKPKRFVMATGIMVTLFLISCKPNDQHIKSAIEEKLNSVPYMKKVSANVRNGEATIAGICNDAACVANCENLTRHVKGVKSVISHLKMADTPVQQSIIYQPDDSLLLAVNDAVKNYRTIQAEVKNGVITLSGQIRKKEVRKLITRLHSLNPVNIENNMAVK